MGFCYRVALLSAWLSCSVVFRLGSLMYYISIATNPKVILIYRLGFRVGLRHRVIDTRPVWPPS